MREKYDKFEFMAYCYIVAAIGLALYSVTLWDKFLNGGVINDLSWLVLMPIAAMLFAAIGIVNIVNKN